MIVYLHGSPDKNPVESHTLIICPAQDTRQPFELDDKGKPTGKRSDPPDDWMDEIDGLKRPRQIPVVFRYGQADVEDSIGRYMLARGLAQKSRLIIPNNWDG